MCNDHCPDFIVEICPQLKKAPYVCNGCSIKYRCTLEKRFYQAAPAHEEYRSMLSESRQGLSITEEEIKHLDSVISPKIMKNQSIHHICVNNKDSIMVSESTIYRLVDYNLLTARNIDLPRKVRFAARKVRKHHKIDKNAVSAAPTRISRSLWKSTRIHPSQSWIPLKERRREGPPYRPLCKSRVNAFFHP